jgi:hypothetical protein
LSKLSETFARRKNMPYPETRSAYTNAVAITGEVTYGKVVMELGLEVEPHLIQHHGTDIIVKESNLGMEAWNWYAPHCYEEREESVKKNLEPFANRYLLTSFISDLVSYRITMTYNENPIEIVELGFQILPNEYIPWATANKITYGVKFCNKRTMKIVRNRLLSIPSIREKVAKAKDREKLESVNTKNNLETIQTYKKKDTKDISCYVYSIVLNKSLDRIMWFCTFIQEIIEDFKANLDEFEFKIRLKNCLLELKSSVKARFFKSYSAHFISVRISYLRQVPTKTPFSKKDLDLSQKA